MANLSDQIAMNMNACRYIDYLKVMHLNSEERNNTEPEASPPSQRQSLELSVDSITSNKVAHSEVTETSQASGFCAPPSIDATLVDSDTGDASPISNRKLRRRSTGGSLHARQTGKQSKASAQPKDTYLRVIEQVDDYASEAEMSGLDDYYRSENGKAYPKDRSIPKSRYPKSQAQGVGSDSSCSDGGCSWDKKPEVYDSDLESDVSDVGKAVHAKKMRRWKSLAKDRFEKMLLDCIVNTDSIRPNYEDIYIDRQVVQKLERVTKLSLERPKAFGYGVLAGNRVTGAVLYGPPGTGKSLLAKGMARQSGFNMILASTAELWQKCHGDDEKVIKALFSMARKLYPAIVFIDEADAMLGSRKAGEKRHIRAMLNQFLMEWDGLTSGANSPFILLATNRPFDLDPAVLRRAPVHIHLDIPTPDQRLGILNLLLKHEKLASDIPARLAKMTSRYTGSDLKNLCVTAATNCVGEQEMDTANRELKMRHFQSAMVTIKATALGKTLENEFKNFEKKPDRGMQQEQEDE